MSPAVVNLRASSLADLEDFFVARGEPRYRGEQVYRRIHRLGAREIEEFSELPSSVRSELQESVDYLPSAEVLNRLAAADGTEKFILGFESGARPDLTIEAVWIVSGGRRTICVSCQGGCSLDCTFCATGALPFAGNLRAWQILEQVYLLERLRGERASNVVFMGMGEPFHNYDEVMAAAATLTAPHGAGLGARRITVSTAGVLPGIERFADERQPFKLAISLNHTDSRARSEIMAINDRYPLSDLIEAARRYTRASGRRVTFEYVMMAGLNMDPEDSRELIRIARSLPCKINLIPFNTECGGLRRPTAAEAKAFLQQLRLAGVAAFDRGSPGREVGGACGMLSLAAG